MHIAAEWGHEGVVGMVVGAGADVNARDEDGRTAMYLGSAAGIDGVVRMLIDAGVDVNAVCGPSRRVALHAAAERGHSGVVGLLVGAGADVTLRNVPGVTAEQLARQHRHEAVLRVLAAH